MNKEKKIEWLLAHGYKQDQYIRGVFYKQCNNYSHDNFIIKLNSEVTLEGYCFCPEYTIEDFDQDSINYIQENLNKVKVEYEQMMKECSEE